MAPKFGTSGLRGLVSELTPALVSEYVRAFLAACPIGTGLYVARDLRPSSPEIAAAVITTARGAGFKVTDCGVVPTPALALASMQAGAAAVMITGSHIPADRNGLKFYLPDGEISKADEAAILAALESAPAAIRTDQGTLRSAEVGPAWVARYVAAFGTTALRGLKVGVWSHSAVSRDLLIQTLHELGAEVIDLGRSDRFIPVDTEAVPDWAKAKITSWVTAHRLDALVSTDGDGDRPLVADASGRVIPGDILGQITATVIGAEHVVTPISSNSGLEAEGRFGRVLRTRIGSPFVIEGMKALGDRVVGYEANGGFLLGFPATLANGILAPMATRDSLLPIIAPLSCLQNTGSLAELVACEPARFTATDRLEGVEPVTSRALIEGFLADRTRLAAFLSSLDETPLHIDQTDGLRVNCASGRVVHFRPSGNAPELRLYVEAETAFAADDLLAKGLSGLARAITTRLGWAP